MRGMVFLFVLLSSLARATTATADELDDFINAQLRSQRIPGLALAVVKDGQVVKAAGYGVADRTSGAAVTADTVFKIGSISKPILAAAVMRLVQEGRIRLDAPVRTYLQDAPSTWDGITVRHLLTHTAVPFRASSRGTGDFRTNDSRSSY